MSSYRKRKNEIEELKKVIDHLRYQRDTFRDAIIEAKQTVGLIPENTIFGDNKIVSLEEKNTVTDAESLMQIINDLPLEADR